MSSVSSLNSLLSSAASGGSAGPSIDLSSLLTAAMGATSSGIDVTAAVNAAIYAAQAPERLWQAQQSALQSQISALGSLQTNVNTVVSDLNNLNDLNGALSANTVTSGNSAVVTGTATSSAQAGTHSVQVDSLATKGSWYSSPLSSASASMGSSSLTISVASGAKSTFNLGPNGLQSLSATASAVNQSNLGVSASVITDATGSRLALVSTATGSSADFTVQDTGTAGSSWTSASLASASSTVPQGSYQLSDGSQTVRLDVAAGTSLNALATQVNSLGLALQASVVTDAGGAHLQFDATGGNAITISADPALSLTQASTAQNASLRVDGVPISSATNTLTQAIPGVTLSIAGISSGNPVSISVGPDASQVTSAIGQFVSDYNAAVSSVAAQFQYNTSTQSEGALGGDGTVRSLQSALLGIASYSSATATGSTASPSTLASLGITMNDDGTLSLDSSKLTQAVQENATGVRNFFQGTGLNGFASHAKSILDAFSNPATGSLQMDAANLNQQVNAFQAEISNYESGYIASQRTQLTSMYSQAEIALQQLPTQIKQIQAQLGQNSGN